MTVFGSGDPFVRPSQASACVMVEVGNEDRDLFLFDLGSGSLRNLTGQRLPVTATTRVFLSHLHAFPLIRMQDGAVGYRLDYAGRSVVFSGATRPCLPPIDAAAGADLLIHETFPSPSVYA